MSTGPDPFFQACGGTAPIRLEIDRPDGTATTAEFQKPFVLIGRDGRADVTVPDPDVASRQLYLQLVGGRLFGVQLSDRSNMSSAGASWDSGWVHPGDELAIGRVRVRVLAAGDPAEAPPGRDPLAPRDDAPAYAFEPVASRSNPPRRFVYRQDLLLAGRTAPSEFLIRHPDASRCHAAVVRTPAGLWVVDLLTRTGTAVNGTRAPVAELRGGDELFFGRVGVRVRFPAGGPARPAGESFAAAPAALSPVPAEVLEPVLDQVAALQQQTFEQFREVLASVMQMVGGVLNEQRQFIREELDRLERIVTAVQPAAAAPAKSLPPAPAAAPAAPAPQPQPAPRPAAGRPQMDEVQLHAWLEQRLGTLNQQQSAVWDRFVKLLKGG